MDNEASAAPVDGDAPKESSAVPPRLDTNSANFVPPTREVKSMDNEASAASVDGDAPKESSAVPPRLDTNSANFVSPTGEVSPSTTHVSNSSGRGTALGQPPSIGPDTPFNPFQNTSSGVNAYEVFKMIVNLPLFLIRLLVMTLSFLLGYILTCIALLGAKNTLTQPFPKWRRNLLVPVQWCARSILWSVGFWYIKVKGKPAPRNVAPILISNHVSFIDPVFVFMQHLPVIVTAKENLALPVAGKVMEALQAITVDRANPSSRKIAAAEIRRRAVFNDWAKIALFPEATTTNGRALVSFKTGAFTPGLPIQPMIVRYPHSWCDPSWVVEGPPTHILLFKLMTQFANFMEVEYLPVVFPTQRDLRNPLAFTERTRHMMARTLNCMVTEHSFGDVALAMEAQKMRLPSGSINVEFGKMERLFRLDLRTAKAYFAKFTAMDVNRSGVLTMAEFLKGLDVPDTPETRQVFELFDTSERGYINFREFLAGLAFISSNSNFKESIERAFRMADTDSDGKISREETAKVLKAILPTSEVSQRLYDALDVDKDGLISWDEFSQFLQKNPEYLAIILNAQPNLLGSGQGEDLTPPGVPISELRRTSKTGWESGGK